MARKILKTCPFCRQAPTIEQDEIKEWWVRCNNKLCAIHPATRFYTTEFEALLAWNTRTKNSQEPGTDDLES